MTGYGRGEAVLHDRTITVELRAVNNRYLDCSVKIPRLYVFAEAGAVDCCICSDFNIIVDLNDTGLRDFYDSLRSGHEAESVSTDNSAGMDNAFAAYDTAVKD